MVFWQIHLFSNGSGKTLVPLSVAINMPDYITIKNFLSSADLLPLPAKG